MPYRGAPPAIRGRDGCRGYGPVVITVAGEVLIDLVGLGDGDYRAVPGGAPANVAIALARLGVPTTLLARISRDAFGRRLRDHLSSNGVLLDAVVDASQPTTLAVAGLDAAGRAAYDFYVQGTADWQWRADELPATLPAGTAALAVGSLALALPPGAQVLERLAERERRRGLAIAYDPNIRPALARSPADERLRVERQVAASSIVKCSDEDAGWLYPGEPVEQVARRWLGLGPDLVVLTLGPSGALAVNEGAGLVHRGGRPVDVVDTVGAGDSFLAGLLAGMLGAGLLGPASPARRLADAGTLGPLLDRAILISALTCARRGADPPDTRQVAAAAAFG